MELLLQLPCKALNMEGMVDGNSLIQPTQERLAFSGRIAITASHCACRLHYPLLNYYGTEPLILALYHCPSTLGVGGPAAGEFRGFSERWHRS